jgi:hypothetical protein
MRCGQPVKIKVSDMNHGKLGYCRKHHARVQRLRRWIYSWTRNNAMKTVAVVLFLFSFFALPISAQTVTSVVENVSIIGTGFVIGDTVTASPSGTVCTNIVIVSTTNITATCPDGTVTVTIIAPPPPPPTTYPYVLKSTWTAPATGAFSWTVGAASPAMQSIRIFDSSPCPPVAPVPYCSWPGTTVTSDSPWLVVSPASGTTAFVVTVLINTTGLTTSPPTGHIIITQKLFSTPTLSIPVTLTVTGAPTPHSVTLKWIPGTNDVSFNVMRATTAAGPFTQIASVTTPTDVDLNVTSGSSYWYQVTGVAGTAVSPPSNTITVTIP